MGTKGYEYNSSGSKCKLHGLINEYITHNVNGTASNHGLVTGDMMFMVYKNGNVTGFQAHKVKLVQTHRPQTQAMESTMLLELMTKTINLQIVHQTVQEVTQFLFTLSDASPAATQLEIVIW